MQSFTDMAEAHDWTLRRLREMAGRLTEQAYLRAGEAADGDPEDLQRWMLVFDRMARGLRLTLALEARLARERRRDAEDLARGAPPRWRGRAEREGSPGGACAESDEADRERDVESDDDGLPADAPLCERIGRLKAIIQGVGESDRQPLLHSLEQRMMAPQRAARARRAGSLSIPDEPWDMLAEDDRGSPEDRPWRGSG
jgi:hypothetical protein